MVPRREKALVPGGHLPVLLMLSLIGACAAVVSPQNVAFAIPTHSLGTGRVRSASSQQMLSSAFLGRGMTFVPVPTLSYSRRSGSSSRGSGISMFLGQDSGILGVGAPEIAVIVLVGYFILGPTELYKLTKEIGKTIQNFRSLSTEASKSFESTMEDQLELEELRKAQRELNDAFSFRRSINTDEANDFNKAFTDTSSPVPETTTAAAASATANIDSESATRKKKRKMKRRRVKRGVSTDDAAAANGAAGTGSQVPDLDMSDSFESSAQVKQEEQLTAEATVASGGEATADTVRLREQRNARLTSGTQPENNPDWFDNGGVDELKTEKQGGEEASPFGALWAESKAEEQDRFAAQLSGQWNDSILENEDKLSPLAKIMDRLAILEEEKKAATLRLEDEFRMRGELEEKFYRRKRELLEQSAAEVQAQAYAGMAAQSEEEIVPPEKGQIS